MKFIQFSQPSAKYCARYFIYVILVSLHNNLVQQKEHACFTHEEIEVRKQIGG